MMRRFSVLLVAAMLLAILPGSPAGAESLFDDPIAMEPTWGVVVDYAHDRIFSTHVEDWDIVGVVVRDLAGQYVTTVDIPMIVHSLSLDGERLWGTIRVGNYDTEAVAISTTSLLEVERFDLAQSQSTAGMVETDGRLVVSHGERGVDIYDLADNAAVTTFVGALGSDGRLAASPATPGLVAVATPGPYGLFLVDVSVPEVVASRPDINAYVSDPVFSPDGTRLVDVSQDGGTMLAVPGLTSAGYFPVGDARPALGAWSADGSRIAIGANDGSGDDPEVLVFDVGSNDPVWSYDLGYGEEDLHSLAISPDGSTLHFVTEGSATGNTYLRIMDTSFQWARLHGEVTDTVGLSVAYPEVDLFDEEMNYLATISSDVGLFYDSGPIRPGTYHALFVSRPPAGVDGAFGSWYGGAPVLRPDLSVPIVVADGEDLTVNVVLRPWFVDVEDSVFRGDVFWMADAGITAGCNPPISDLYCPDFAVTRGQMAAFLVRALGLTERVDVGFTDDDFSIFEADIEKLAAAGITKGCNPPFNTMFCPDDLVTRGQMAAFLHRALGGVLVAGEPVEFSDDDLSVFEADIEWLGSVGVTRGCNPPDNTMFCPDAPVTRGQMAAFLRRALG